MNKKTQELADQLIKHLLKFPPLVEIHHGEVSHPRDDEARDVARYILQTLKVYDAHGCPLCLS